MNAMNEKSDPEPDEPVSQRKPPSLLFRLVIPVTFVFVFTCFLVLTHDLLGDQNSKFAEVLRDHGTKILAWEAVAAIVMSIVAMFFDRMKTLRSERAEADSTGESATDRDGSSEGNDGRTES